MKRLLFSLFVTLALASPRPAHATGWVDGMLEWFTELFATSDNEQPAAISAARADSLRATPLGLLLHTVPDSDTLAYTNWPHLTADVRADLDRYQRVQRNTVLLTDPQGRLPLSAERVRVIYRKGQRPAFFLNMLLRFVDVQEVAHSDLLAPVLRVSPQLPTIILADDSDFAPSEAWYLDLADTNAVGTTLIHFGDVERLPALPDAWSVINTSARSKEGETLIAQALVGAETIDARSVTATLAYPIRTGYRLTGERTGFRLPEQLGIDREQLERVDYQINRGIRYRAMPGAQLLVMKNGEVVYEKAYGHQTYRKQPVDVADLYDLASVTKAAATSLAVMKLYDDGEIALNKRVRDYLPQLKKRAIGAYRVDQLLSHQTGLQPNLPVQEFIGKQFAADSQSVGYRYAIGPDRWLDSRVPEWVAASLHGQINRTKRPIHLYSDLNYYLLQLIVESVSGQPLDQFVSTNFYEPMGLDHLTYRPFKEFPKHQLVPTINEPWMRGGLLRGYVHDEAAALLGGVAGHAGLFGNAHDLGQLFQLLNNRGSYRGQTLLSPATVALFTGRSPYNYRALAFDRLIARWPDAVQGGASNMTVGHLGFTGTSVWADPENDLVFVLLTNRVHPDPKAKKFEDMGIRTRVSQAVYRALNSWEVNS